MNKNFNLLIGLQLTFPIYSLNEKNDVQKKHFENLNELILFLNSINIKTSIYLNANFLSLMDKKYIQFSRNVRELIEKKNLELISGGINEPYFPIIPQEDREVQIKLMSRLINHLYGYNPSGAWLTEAGWSSSVSVDLSKSRILYTFMPKEYFIEAGENEEKITGYFITESDTRRVAVFPINTFINSKLDKSQEEVLQFILDEYEKNKINTQCFFFTGYLDDEKLNYLKKIFLLIEKNKNIQTLLFNDFYNSHKSTGRVYLPNKNLIKYNSTSKSNEHFLIKYPEANLLHKKMERVSKKINAAKDGKSRFKVIKEMINQAHDLLLKGQNNSVYWDSYMGGIYLPEERMTAYTDLIKAENLIDKAARKDNNWIQVTEIDYDCDGNDETLLESETQNIYISPGYGGAILEHDLRQKNINLISSKSRKKEPYHDASLPHDSYLRVNLIDHFLDLNTNIDDCIKSNLNYLTDEIIFPYNVDKVKAKEQTCRVSMFKELVLNKLPNNPVIYIKKDLSIRIGEPNLNIQYSFLNKSNENVSFLFSSEFNFNFYANTTFYIGGANPQNQEIYLPQAIENINEISFLNKEKELDLNLIFNKNAKLFKYPVETISYKNFNLTNIIQGICLMPSWKISLKAGEIFELEIVQSYRETINTQLQKKEILTT